MFDSQNSMIRQPSDLAPFIDHTLLKADATSSDIENLCREAREHGFKAVCVNPIFVRQTRDWLAGSNVATASVIGFPLGTQLSATKALEAELAVADGASEIDMVLRLDWAKENRWDDVEKDIAAVVSAAGGHIVKVIFETGLLSPAQIVEACGAAEHGGAHFVKTATGFLGRGATLDDVILMRESCSDRMQIKASGGIKTFAQAKAFIDAGATRLGTSSGVALVTGAVADNGY